MYMCSAALDGRCTLWTCKHYSIHKLYKSSYQLCLHRWNPSLDLTCRIEEKEIHRHCIKVKDITKEAKK